VPTRAGVAVAALLAAVPALAPSAPVPPAPTRADWPMLGGTPARNPINRTDRNAPDAFDTETGENVLWKADLGSRTHGGPVVAGGRVYVATNNARPRDGRDVMITPAGEVEPIDKGVLMCFDARTGKFLWQVVHPKLPSRVNDWPEVGLCSTPTAEGDRVYYVSNRAEVVCLHAAAADVAIVWSFDMIKELGVFPHNMAACSPLVVGDAVFVVTANGVDEGHLNLPAPDAPSFVALDKKTGKLLWKDNSPGKNIMHGQWGNPSFAADPVPQVIFPGGDGWLRAFDPPTGTLLWKFDANPKDAVYELGGAGSKSDFVLAAPVVADGRVYIGVGQDPEHSTGVGHLWCIDLKRAVEGGARNADRDVSPELIVRVEKQPGGPGKVVVRPNPDSALAWHFGGDDPRPHSTRDFLFGRTMSSVCVIDGVVYASELLGLLHALDAKTGKRFWWYDTKASIWGSPHYCDGKVYLGNGQGDLCVFRHRANPAAEPDPDDALAVPLPKAARAMRRQIIRETEAKVLVRKVELDAAIYTSPCVAGGVLYVATDKALYAIGSRR
jgi:outer membrane protein assembly factor BamB